MSLSETPMPPYPWQDELWKSFSDSVSNKRVAHALLVNGVVGVGVEPLAYAMARYLLCMSPIEDVACGRCRACQLLSAGTHPDLFILKQDEDSTQIKVDQVRACVDFVAKTAFADGPKVVVVERAETMNINAANALLKSLEEPQGQTVFILTTNRLSAILPTIRSRCRSVGVSVPPMAQAKAWLSEQGLDLDQAILDQAGGAPVLVKQWLEGDYLQLRSDVHDILSSLLSHKIGAVQAASKMQALDIEMNLALHIQVLELAIKQRHVTSLPEQQLSKLLVMLSSVGEIYLFRLRDKLVAKLEQVKSRANLNAAMLIEELSMDWVSLAQLVDRK